MYKKLKHTQASNQITLYLHKEKHVLLKLGTLFKCKLIPFPPYACNSNWDKMWSIGIWVVYKEIWNTFEILKSFIQILQVTCRDCRDFKTQACSTVSPRVPITIKVVSPIVNNVAPNDPPICGSLSSADLHQIVNAVYDEIVYWRKNLFILPSGSAGKEYVCEATRLINI